jgi:hypothetical protein
VRGFVAETVHGALRSRRLADSVEPAEEERLAVLRDSLGARARAQAETAIRAATLLGDGPALDAARESLSAPDPVQRANALEVLETVGDGDLLRPLLSLWEPGRASTADPRWRKAVLEDPDEWIRSCARWALRDTRGAMAETLATVPLMERLVVLRSVPLFAALPPQDLKPIAAIATEHRFDDADTIAEQGDPGEEMHIIVEGYVMVILREPNGHRRVLAVRSAGDVIGEMAVLTSAPRMASLAAKGAVRLLTIGRREFESMLRERPETSLALLRVLCGRLADRETADTV